MAENNEAFFLIMEKEKSNIGDGFYFPMYVLQKNDQDDEKIQQMADDPMAFLTVYTVTKEAMKQVVSHFHPVSYLPIY